MDSCHPSQSETLICSRPFSWLEVHRSGETFLCCPGWMKRPAGNLLQENLKDIWNGTPAQRIRAEVLSGSFHPCNSRRCPYLASHVLPVGKPEAVPNPLARAAILARRTHLVYPPQDVNLCFDPRCNLTCGSCRSGSIGLSVEEMGCLDALTERIVDQVLPGARRLLFAGHGEPFASPAYLRLLKMITAECCPKLEEIRLHSNGLLWDAATWADLSGIHPWVNEAEISVDAATEETYELNRGGGDFARLQANLRFIASLGIRLKLSCVVQANNVREMVAFADLAEKYGAEAYFSRLVNWGTFTRQEYCRRGVHLAEHPEHEFLLQQLRRLRNRPGVTLGNLGTLLTEP